MFSAPFIRALMVLLKPFIWMFAQWEKFLVKLFNKPSDDRGITDEELMTIVEERAKQEGGIDADESTLIRSAIGFMDLETSDIYTPRVDIESIPLDATKKSQKCFSIRIFRGFRFTRKISTILSCQPEGFPQFHFIIPTDL